MQNKNASTEVQILTEKEESTTASISISFLISFGYETFDPFITLQCSSLIKLQSIWQISLQ